MVLPARHAALALALLAPLAACGEVPPGHGLPDLGVPACVDCHGDRYLAATDPNHVAGGFPTTCEACHGTTSWRPATSGNHDLYWPLTGAHQVASCASCHIDNVYAGTPRDCAGCHQPDYDATTDPNHVAASFPLTCATCHDTAAWRPAALDHDAVWPLEGRHETVDCASCHVNNVYTGTPRDCEGCHLPDYQATTDPNHVADQFPTACAGCHTAAAWRPAGFESHDAYWPIEGRHEQVTCASCHAGGVYAGTPRACEGCHLPDYQATTNPNHVATQIPTTCATCHTAAGWQPATFDHSASWPLEGKHVGPSCAACHAGGVYAGTPRDCAGCHLPDYQAATVPSHTALGLSQNCATCHNVNGWATNTFPGHDPLFPITTGKHRRYTCAECHTTAGNYAAFTCTGCHTGEHALAKMNSEHQGEVGNYQSTLNQYGVERGCLHCHPRGTEDD